MKMKTGKTMQQVSIFMLAALSMVGLTIFHAEARESALIDTPTSVSSITGEEALKWNMPRDLNEFISTTPGVTSSSNANNSTLRIRGMGTDAVSTLTLVNGRRILNTLPDINPKDIQRVDVLSGSSASAIYGSDAVAGVINIITKKPQEEFRESFFNPNASPYVGNPFQTGYRAMATANEDPIGQALSAFYAAGGNNGEDAGDMFSSAVKLRWGLGGPICDLGTAASWQWR